MLFSGGLHFASERGLKDNPRVGMTSHAPFDLDGVLALRELAERGSIQGAAKALGVSRATIRRRLEALEAAAGAPLIHRGERLQLTPSGAVLLERGAELLAAADAALREVRDAASEPTGLARIVMPVGMQLQLVAELFAGAQRVALDVHIELSEVPDPAGSFGPAFDLMFHFGPPPNDAALYSRVVRRAPVRLVASPDYLDARGTPQTPDDLASHTLLIWQGSGHPATEVQTRAGGAIRVQPWFASPNINLLRRLAALGCGIAYAPDGDIADEQGVGPLVPVLPDAIGRDEALRATSPLPGRVDPRAATFAQRVHALLESWPEV